jgi:type II secretory pathway pseudopilin PulG
MQRSLPSAKVVVILSVALLALAYEAHRASANRSFALSLQHQETQLQQQIENLSRERDNVQGELVALREKNRTLALSLAQKTGPAPVSTPQDSVALSGARTNPENKTSALANSWVEAVERLKERLEATPSAKIPELQLLDSADWLEVARNARLDTENGFRKAMSDARKRAEGLFVEKFQAALDIYMDAHDGHWPENANQLKSYFFPPVDDAILPRWQIVPKTDFPGRNFAGDWVFTEKSYADPDFDWQWTVDSANSSGVGPYHYSRESQIEALKDDAEPALKAYMAANGGKQPQDPHDLISYTSGSTQLGAVQMLIQMTGTNHLDP